MAVIDELTGLYNRRYFERHLAMVLNKAQEQDRDMAVMLLDIDYFKPVNDTYGHDAGDVVLKEFATRLQRNIRGVDLACRFGGEEFVVVMPDTDMRAAQGVADEEFKVGAAKPLNITVSAGLALNDQESDTPESVIKRADIALYRAKRAGRNRVVHDAA